MLRFFRLTPLWTLLALAYTYIYISHLYTNPLFWTLLPIFDFFLKFCALPVLCMAPIIAQLIVLDLKIAAPRLVSACRLFLVGLVLLYAISFLKDLYTTVILSSFIDMPVRLSPIHVLYFLAGPISYIALYSPSRNQQ